MFLLYPPPDVVCQKKLSTVFVFHLTTLQTNNYTTPKSSHATKKNKKVLDADDRQRRALFLLNAFFISSFHVINKITDKHF